MPPIRVALCITDLDVGGAERCLTQLATRLDRARFEPVVYCLAPEPADAERSCLGPLSETGVPVHSLGGRSRWQLFWVVLRLAWLMRRHQPQLVQTMLFHANIVGTVAARLARVPKVVAGLRVAERGADWHVRWESRLRQRVDRHVCVSRDVADFGWSEMRIPREKLVVIPNGVDLARFPVPEPAKLTSLGIWAERRVVTFVGRLERQKGLRWLLESAPEWLERLPDCDLLLVGRGPLEPELRRLAEKLGISRRVHFAGWRPDVPEILAVSELLVLPSEWEGMPNVVLEAMASRLPVVASEVEGVRELLGETSDIQTVRFGDRKALAERLVRLLSDPQLAAEVGAANRRRAEEQFSIERMVAAYEDLWESLLNPG